MSATVYDLESLTRSGYNQYHTGWELSQTTHSSHSLGPDHTERQTQPGQDTRMPIMQSRYRNFQSTSANNALPLGTSETGQTAVPPFEVTNESDLEANISNYTSRTPTRESEDSDENRYYSTGGESLRGTSSEGGSQSDYRTHIDSRSQSETVGELRHRRTSRLPLRALFRESERPIQEPPILRYEDIASSDTEARNITNRTQQGISQTERQIRDDLELEMDLVSNYRHVATANRVEAEYCQNEERRSFFEHLERVLLDDLRDLRH